MTCESISTCADVLIDAIGVCLFRYLYLFQIVISLRSNLTIACTYSVFPFLSFLFSVGLALTVFF